MLSVAGAETKPHDLAFVPPGASTLTLTSYDEPVRLLLLGGPPFGEAIVMWWNLVARTHEEVVEWRSAWQDQIVDGRLTDGWFGIPVGDERAPIPAPPLPNARLRSVAERVVRLSASPRCGSRRTTPVSAASARMAAWDH